MREEGYAVGDVWVLSRDQTEKGYFVRCVENHVFIVSEKTLNTGIVTCKRCAALATEEEETLALRAKEQSEFDAGLL